MQIMTLDELINRKIRDYGFATYAECAEGLGISIRLLETIVNGRTTCPLLDTRRTLCAAFDIAQPVLDRAIKNSMARRRFA